MSDAKHTPTPWEIEAPEDMPGYYCLKNEVERLERDLESDDPEIQKRSCEEDCANRDFINQACNNHDALVDALKAIADRTTVQMLCPTAPSQDAADGFKMGAIQATDECALIADQALAAATK